MPRTYRDLEVWQVAIDMVEAVYLLTRTFPDDERFVLVPQMRRCVISVASNIAEGAGRTGQKEFLSFLSIARESLRELETQLTIAVRLKLTPRESAIPIWDLLQRIAQMLPKLMGAIRRTSDAGRRTKVRQLA